MATRAPTSFPETLATDPARFRITCASAALSGLVAKLIGGRQRRSRADREIRQRRAMRRSPVTLRRLLRLAAEVALDAAAHKSPVAWAAAVPRKARPAVVVPEAAVPA